MNTLPVPYSPQLGTGADQYSNDCLEASGKGLAGAYKLCLNMTVNDIYNQIRLAGGNPTYEAQMQQFLASKGLKTDWKVLTLHDLFDNLVTKKPMIVLIHYGTLVTAKLTQFTDFKAGHFMIVVGIDIVNVAVNDPYRSDTSGINLLIPINVFMRCWKDATIDNNISYCALVPQLPICDLSTPSVTWVDYLIISTCNAINVRSQPIESSTTWVRFAWRGEVLHVVGNLTNGYVQLTDGTWVYAAFLVKK